MESPKRDQLGYRSMNKAMKSGNTPPSRPLEGVILVDAKVDLHIAYKAVGAWEGLSSDVRVPDYKPAWILAAVDAYSRVILAITVHSGPPTVIDWVALIDAMAGHGAVSKGWPAWFPHRKPEEIYADENPAFYSAAFQGAVRQLTGKDPQSLRVNSVIAGRGERVLRGVFGAPRIAKAFAEIAHTEGGERFDDAKVVAAMAAVHNETPQRGLGGYTPKAFVISAGAAMDDAA